MSGDETLANKISRTFSTGDYCLALASLKEAISLRGTLSLSNEGLLNIAQTIYSLRGPAITPKEYIQTIKEFMNLKADIFKFAAQVNPFFGLHAIETLVDVQRWKEATYFIPLVNNYPEYPLIINKACVAIFATGDEKGALLLLRDQLKTVKCSIRVVNELVKIEILTEIAGNSFIEMSDIIKKSQPLGPWEIAYFCELGISLGRLDDVIRGLDIIEAAHGTSVAERLGRAAIHLERLELHAAYPALAAPVDGMTPTEWHAELCGRLSRLFRADQMAQQWRQLKAQAAGRRLPKVALTLSGFVRGFDRMVSLLEFLVRHGERWDIEIFLQVFDRLGNIFMDEGLPKSICDYGHGGFYREVNKTKPLRIGTLYDWLAPLVMQVEARQPDAHYVASLGMEHPQWQAVWESFCLFDRHRIKSGAEYTYVIRGRYDKSYETLELDSIDLHDTQIATPANVIYGSLLHQMCDQLAVGPVSAMRAYCSIGDGRNFRYLEETPEWLASNEGFESSHEAHLALWLEMHGIEVLKPAWLTL